MHLAAAARHARDLSLPVRGLVPGYRGSHRARRWTPASRAPRATRSTAAARFMGVFIRLEIKPPWPGCKSAVLYPSRSIRTRGFRESGGRRRWPPGAEGVLERRLRVAADLRGQGLGGEGASGSGLEGGDEAQLEGDDPGRRLLSGFDAGLVVGVDRDKRGVEPDDPLIEGVAAPSPNTAKPAPASTAGTGLPPRGQGRPVKR